MTDPESRRRAVGALAGIRAARRVRETGEAWDDVLPQCIAEAGDDPEVDAIITSVDAAPPLADWDPARLRAIRLALRQPGR